MVVCIALGVDDCLEGVPAHPYISGGTRLNGKSNHPIYVLGCESNCSDDEDNNVYAAEFAWPSNNKSCTCGSLKPIQKDRQDNIKFTFDISKCDLIYLMS